MAKTAAEINTDRQARGQTRIAFWLNKEQAEQLKAGAEKHGMKVSAAIRLALEAAGLVEAT